MSSLLERAASINWLRGTPNDSKYTKVKQIDAKEVELQFENVGNPSNLYPLQEGEARTIMIGIGSDIANLLGWKEGDHLYMDHNPDALLEVRLVKKEVGGKGRAVKLRTARSGLIITRSFEHYKKVKLPITARFIVQHHIFGGNQLLFKLEKVTMIGEAQHEGV